MPDETYPSNSRRSRLTDRPDPKSDETTEDESRKITKVIEGEVTVRKKPWHRRVIETFVGTDDAGGVLRYIAQDVIVPAAKELVTDAVSQGVERMLFGESRGGSRRRRDSHGPIYTNYSNASRTLPREDPRIDISRRARETHDFGEILLDTRLQADLVLEEMFEVLSKFDAVTVADLYAMVGITPSFTDRKYGWFGPDSLRGARPIYTRGRYLLQLPETQLIPS